MENPVKVLVVDDDPPIRSAIREILERCGWAVDTAEGHDEVRESYWSADYDLLVVDVALARESSGITLAEEFHADHPGTPILFMSGFVDLDVSLAGIPSEASDFIGKPLSVRTLITKASSLMHGPRRPGGGLRHFA